MLSSMAVSSKALQTTVTFDSDPDIYPQKGLKEVTLRCIYMWERETS